MSLTPAQLRFIGPPGKSSLFLSADPTRLRAQWLAEGGRALPGYVPDPANPPAEAVAVKVYRLHDGGHMFKGAHEAQRVLGLAELAGLAHLWAEPLRTLNAEGRALAQAAPQPTVPRTFKLPETMDSRMEGRAARLGLNVTEYLRRLVTADLESEGK